MMTCSACYAVGKSKVPSVGHSTSNEGQSNSQSFLSVKASQETPRSEAFCWKEEKLVSIHCKGLEVDEDCPILQFQLSSGLLGWSKNVKPRMTKQTHRTKTRTCGHTEFNQTDQGLGQCLATTQDLGSNAASSLPLNPPYLQRFSRPDDSQL
jgi:hypothetical protein